MVKMVNEYNDIKNIIDNELDYNELKQKYSLQKEHNDLINIEELTKLSEIVFEYNLFEKKILFEKINKELDKLNINNIDKTTLSKTLINTIGFNQNNLNELQNLNNLQKKENLTKLVYIINKRIQYNNTPLEFNTIKKTKIRNKKKYTTRIEGNKLLKPYSYQKEIYIGGSVGNTTIKQIDKITKKAKILHADFVKNSKTEKLQYKTANTTHYARLNKIENLKIKINEYMYLLKNAIISKNKEEIKKNKKNLKNVLTKLNKTTYLQYIKNKKIKNEIKANINFLANSIF